MLSGLWGVWSVVDFVTCLGQVPAPFMYSGLGISLRPPPGATKFRGAILFLTPST